MLEKYQSHGNRFKKFQPATKCVNLLQLLPDWNWPHCTWWVSCTLEALRLWHHFALWNNKCLHSTHKFTTHGGIRWLVYWRNHLFLHALFPDVRLAQVMTTVLTDSCKESCAGLKLVLDWSFQRAPIVPCWQLIISNTYRKRMQEKFCGKRKVCRPEMARVSISACQKSMDSVTSQTSLESGGWSLNFIEF
jgi:hypothetical protein